MYGEFLPFHLDISRISTFIEEPNRDPSSRYGPFPFLATSWGTTLDYEEFVSIAWIIARKQYFGLKK